MKPTFISRHWFLGLASSFCLLPLPSTAAFAQGGAPQAASAAGALAKLSAAFSGATIVHNVELSGAANWYAGSLEDSGTVSLSASDDGSSQMQLILDMTGQITESQTGKGTSARCQWSGKDGVSHSLDYGDCWRAALWFLPAFSLQPSTLSENQELTDLSEGVVGSGEAIYHHLQGQVVLSGSSSSNKDLGTLTQRTTTDIGLDPTSSLPAVLAYSVHPNNGAQVSIPIEIHYSDYRSVAGAQVPFHIERYVNGSLQLDIHLGSAQVN